MSKKSYALSPASNCIMYNFNTRFIADRVKDSTFNIFVSLSPRTIPFHSKEKYLRWKVIRGNAFHTTTRTNFRQNLIEWCLRKKVLANRKNTRK